MSKSILVQIHDLFPNGEIPLPTDVITEYLTKYDPNEVTEEEGMLG